MNLGILEDPSLAIGQSDITTRKLGKTDNERCRLCESDYEISENIAIALPWLATNSPTLAE